MMEELLSPYKSQLKLLETIPGVSKLSAMQILSKIGPEMTAFTNVRAFISWCGLCPARNQSNSKHKSVRIGKGGQYLKPVLIQCALIAVKDAYFESKYKSVCARRQKKRALIAIARKMMTAAYHMLLTGEAFNPTDLEEEEILEEVDNVSADMTSDKDEEEQTEIQQRVQKTVQELIALTKDAEPALTEKLNILLEQIGIIQPTASKTDSSQID